MLLTAAALLGITAASVAARRGGPLVEGDYVREPVPRAVSRQERRAIERAQAKRDRKNARRAAVSEKEQRS